MIPATAASDEDAEVEPQVGVGADEQARAARRPRSSAG